MLDNKQHYSYYMNISLFFYAILVGGSVHYLVALNEKSNELIGGQSFSACWAKSCAHDRLATCNLRFTWELFEAIHFLIYM